MRWGSCRSLLRRWQKGGSATRRSRALTRVADASNEDYLLNIALCGTASHVEQVVRGYRRALDAAELTREAIQQRDQSLWFHTEPDGSMVIRGRLPAEVGLCSRRRSRRRKTACPSPKTFPRKRLLTPCQRMTCIGRGSAGSKRSPRSPRASWPQDPQELSGGDRQQIVVHVDAETLKHSHAGRCELEHGPSIAAETARRLSCDASLVAIIENDRANRSMSGAKRAPSRRPSAGR